MSPSSTQPGQGGRSNEVYFRLIYVVPTEQLFNTMRKQQYSIAQDLSTSQTVEIMQWACDHIEQYVLKLSI
eukprot:jgi/Hompol1/1651/HPOL_000825-RA